MRVIIQRVNNAKVESGGAVVGKINKGLLTLFAVKTGDGEKDADKMANKVANLRVFSDENGKMNRSVLDVGGEILAVSQFTLYGDCKKGTRPGFTESEKPGKALLLYERFVDKLKSLNIKTEIGAFGKHMSVSLENDGPVTLILDI